MPGPLKGSIKTWRGRTRLLLLSPFSSASSFVCLFRDLCVIITSTLRTTRMDSLCYLVHGPANEVSRLLLGICSTVNWPVTVILKLTIECCWLVADAWNWIVTMGKMVNPSSLMLTHSSNRARLSLSFVVWNPTYSRHHREKRRWCLALQIALCFVTQVSGDIEHREPLFACATTTDGSYSEGHFRRWVILSGLEWITELDRWRSSDHETITEQRSVGFTIARRLET